jgi:hypothetical protein
VTWTSLKGDDSGAGIRQQRYAVDGQKVGLEVLVNTTTISDQFDSTVTALTDGGGSSPGHPVPRPMPPMPLSIFTSSAMRRTAKKSAAKTE